MLNKFKYICGAKNKKNIFNMGSKVSIPVKNVLSRTTFTIFLTLFHLKMTMDEHQNG